MPRPRTLALALTLALAPACAPPNTPASDARPRPSSPPPPAASPAPTAPAPLVATAGPRYPVAPRGDVVDVFHGVKVADPYRGLEQLDSAETRAWVQAENQLTDAVLAHSPARDAFRARLAALDGVEEYSLPRRRGGRVFWAHNSGTQDQWVLFSAKSVDASAAEVLLDPNTLSPDGSLAFHGWIPSEDGARVAYGLSIGGGDWQSWHIRDVATGHDLPDELDNLKYYAPVFTKDGKGLYYSHFPAPAKGKEISEADHDCKLYFHALGSAASTDVVVYERPDHPSWQFRPRLTEDGRYLVVEIGDGEVGDRGEEQLVYLDLKAPHPKPVALVDTFDAEHLFLGSRGPIFYVQTTLGAATKRIVAIDTRAPSRDKWKEIVKAGANAIDAASLVGEQLIVTELKDAHTAAVVYDLTGKKLRELPLPGLGTAFGFGGRAGDTDTYYGFESLTSPGSIYRLDLATGASTPWRTPKLAFDPATLETTQVFYPSKDGTKIPMFLTAKKGTPRDGTSPTLLTGYGGFGASMTPYFDPVHVAWMERGGTVALANLRGGGEYGEAWHQAAMRTHRQVVYDDFAAAAAWLVAEHYTTKERLGSFGTSGGGLLVAAVAMQRPELFGAVAPLAGVLDMLRFPLFGEGAGWQGEMGSPDVPDEFRALLAISPLHNVRPGTHYPAMLVVTGDHDVRVAPLHSYKFAAALQAAQAGPAPVLLRVRTTAGHGGATRKSAQLDDHAELLSFFARYLGMTP